MSPSSDVGARANVTIATTIFMLRYAFKAVFKEAGITAFPWHDQRHTWASWHVRLGAPLHVLKELGGWATPEMVNRYAH